LFEPTFTVKGLARSVTFPAMIVMSIGPDVIRNVYRHQRTGCSSIRGWWLNQQVAPRLRTRRRRSGSRRIVDWQDTQDNLTRTTRESCNDQGYNPGVHIMVLNVLTVEPGATTHN
jgi:hypothetical protein